MATIDAYDALSTEANTWLQMCGACDAGLTTNCTCPTGDYRSIIHRLDMERVALRTELMAEHPEWFELASERRPRFQGHSDGFSNGVTLAAYRFVTPWVEIPDEVLSDEAIQMLRERLTTIRTERHADPT